jgi:predicted amidohydrolase YtcJ
MTDNPSANSHADTVIVNAEIITADAGFRTVKALAVTGGRFTVVGTEAEAMAAAGPTTRVLDLGGRAVLPGFIDTHGHLGMFGREKHYVDLAGARSAAQICARIEAAAASTPPGTPILTTPVGEPPYFFNMPSDLEEGRFPTRWELDSAAPDHPVYVTAPTNRVPNSALFNSQALRLAGLNDGEVPRGGANRARVTEEAYVLDGIEVVRDPSTGDPTGELRNMQPAYNPSTFFQRLTAFAPRHTYEYIRDGIAMMAPDFPAWGTTTLLENHLTTPEEIRAYAELDLPVRVFFAFTVDWRKPLAEIEEMLRTVSFAAGSGFGSDRLQITGVCIGIDGPHWHGRGVSDRPYLNPYGDMVMPGPVVPPETYRAIARMAAGYGLRVHTCVGGRGAIDIVLDALSELDREIPLGDRRWVLEHAEFATEAQIAECRRLGIVPTTTTNFIWGKGAEVFIDRMGPDFADNAVPLRWWLDAGVPVCQSTDWGPHDTMFTLWQSLARRVGLTGGVLGVDQRITREEAIRIFTNNGAHALFMENELGSIEAGKLADLVVLSDNPLSCAQDAIKDIEVLATAVGGRFVHGPEDFSSLVEAL